MERRVGDASPVYRSGRTRASLWPRTPLPALLGRATTPRMVSDDPPDPPWRAPIRSFDDALGRRIVDTHIWAVTEGLRGSSAQDLFDGYRQRLVMDGMPLWRFHVSMETLHPQWSGYGYVWRRGFNAIGAERYEHGSANALTWAKSPLRALTDRAEAGEPNPTMRRRLADGPDQRDFPVLEEFFAEGATDYVAYLYIYGEGNARDRSQGSGIVYSFVTDHEGGFANDDLTVLQATLPALSLAMKAHTGHVIASGLLGTYLGQDAGRRVHEGAVTRGSVERLHAVIWFADIRGFTPISDSASGADVVDLLNAIFEALAAPLRSRGGQILKFIGDAMLATFSVEGTDRAETCRRAIQAATEAMQNLTALNAAREAAGLPSVAVDLALHLGEVLYGNVGATDRLDFTVIGPAVNEAARIEALCEPLGRGLLVSSEFAAAAAEGEPRLVSVGHHALRGVRESKEIFALAEPRSREPDAATGSAARIADRPSSTTR